MINRVLRQIILSLLISFGMYESVLGGTNLKDTLMVNQRELRPCQGTTYLIQRAYTMPLQATVIRVRPSGWLYIYCPAVSTYMNLEVCYLPVQACEEGLILLITGNHLKSPRGDSISDCRPDLPFQLTSLKIVRQ